MCRFGQGGANFEPGVRGVDFLEREIRIEQLADNFFAFDDEKPELLAMLFFAKGTETLNLCLVSMSEFGEARWAGATIL